MSDRSTEADAEILDDLEALPRVRTLTRWERLWRPFWVLPTLICVLAVAAGILVPLLDERIEHTIPYLFEGGPEGARSLLGSIAGAMISVTGLVFSVTLVALQLASSQFTPRVLQEFLHSRIVQVTLGIFAASFIYSLTVLRAVKGDFGEMTAFVPQMSISLAFLLVIAAVAMFLVFIHHITRSIQVASMISDIGDETVAVARRYYSRRGSASGSAEWDRPDAACLEVRERKWHGVLAQVRYQTLVDLAKKHDVVVEIAPQVGDFLPNEGLLARIWGQVEEDEADGLRTAVANALQLAQDRMTHQDPEFGVRKLVDIGERALSPGTNDPTTAVQVLDELHRILRIVVDRHDPPSVVTVDDQVRLVHRPQRVGALIDLAFEEILHWGETSLQVPRRVITIIDDLLTLDTGEEHAARLRHWRSVAESALAP